MLTNTYILLSLPPPISTHTHLLIYVHTIAPPHSDPYETNTLSHTDTYPYKTQPTHIHTCSHPYTPSSLLTAAQHTQIQAITTPYHLQIHTHAHTHIHVPIPTTTTFTHVYTHTLSPLQASTTNTPEVHG